MAEFFPIRKKTCIYLFICTFIKCLTLIFFCVWIVLQRKGGPVFVRDCLADKERDPDSWMRDPVSWMGTLFPERETRFPNSLRAPFQNSVSLIWKQSLPFENRFTYVGNRVAPLFISIKQKPGLWDRRRTNFEVYRDAVKHERVISSVKWITEKLRPSKPVAKQRDWRFAL